MIVLETPTAAGLGFQNRSVRSAWPMYPLQVHGNRGSPRLKQILIRPAEPMVLVLEFRDWAVECKNHHKFEHFELDFFLQIPPTSFKPSLSCQVTFHSDSNFSFNGITGTVIGWDNWSCEIHGCTKLSHFSKCVLPIRAATRKQRARASRACHLLDKCHSTPRSTTLNLDWVCIVIAKRWDAQDGSGCKGVIHSAVGMVGSDTGKLTLALELPKLSSRPDIHRKCLMNPALNFGTHRNKNSKFVSKQKLSRVGLCLDSYLPRSISQMRMK